MVWACCRFRRPSTAISISTYILGPNSRVFKPSIRTTPGGASAVLLIACAVSSSQALSTILSRASRSTSREALQMNIQITMLAAGSMKANPIRAPHMPTNAPTEERASER